MQVGVEVDVVELCPLTLERPEVGTHPDPHQCLDGGLATQVLVGCRRQAHPEPSELLRRVAADPVGGRVAEHVVRVDERDDEAERLREPGSGEPALDLLDVDLVPALAIARVAAAEVLGLRVLARVRRIPVGEPVIVGEPAGVGGQPAAQLPDADRGAARVGEVPFALVGDLVSGRAEQRRETRGIGAELGLAAGARAEAQRAAGELLQHPATRGRAATEDLGHRPDRARQVARVRAQVGGGQRQADPVLGGEATGEQRRAARRAHRRVGVAVAEAEPRARELGLVRGQLAQPAPSGQ